MSDDCNVVFTEGFMTGYIISTLFFIVFYACKKQKNFEENLPPPYEQV